MSTTIIGIEDVGYSEIGKWESSGLTGYNGTPTRYSSDMGDLAKWSGYAPETGNYKVYVWYPTNASNTDAAKYTIKTLDGSWVKSINQKVNGGQWVKIATVSAVTSTALVVSLMVGYSVNRANAVKYETTTDPADPITLQPPTTDTDSVVILTNQSGYDTGKPKRATVTNVNNGTAFTVNKSSDNSVVFTGSVTGNVADFSTFNVEGSYYIVCRESESTTFGIGKYWMQRVSIGPTLRFMDESRSDTFLPGENSIGWRDSHQFSFELSSLVLQYMANPSAYDRMPRGISNLSTCQYPELRTQTEPDIIWLLKFGVIRYYDMAVNGGKKHHALIKSQLAYFLYLYPYISNYVSRELYLQIRDYTLKEWSNPICDLQWYDDAGLKLNNLFHTQKVIGGIKGEKPPGYAIQPNLMMYEVAKRDGIANYQDFFDAAFNNAEWLINKVDLNDPRYTKGQRMSEHATITGLAYFLEKYPNKAPAGIRKKIEVWADTMVKRSENLWDLRKYADPKDGGTLDQWTGGMNGYNEPGNVAGFMAAAYAAIRVIKNTNVKNRLQEIAIAQIDNVFGRNPFGRHYSYDGPKEIEGVDKGWFEFFNGGAGMLMHVPGVLDGAPKETAYPFDPNADYGYTEGWIAFNTAWNASLAYSAAEDVELKVFDKTFTTEVSSSVSPGSAIGIRLRAPLNFDSIKIETGQVLVTNNNGEKTQVTVTEASADDYYFTSLLTIPSGTTYLDISYGHDLFKKSIRVSCV